VSDALRRIAKPEDESITATVVAVVVGQTSNAVLQFDTVRLMTYG
jgi:hypothetical protein